MLLPSTKRPFLCLNLPIDGNVNVGELLRRRSFEEHHKEDFLAKIVFLSSKKATPKMVTNSDLFGHTSQITAFRAYT